MRKNPQDLLTRFYELQRPGFRGHHGAGTHGLADLPDRPTEASDNVSRNMDGVSQLMDNVFGNGRDARRRPTFGAKRWESSASTANQNNQDVLAVLDRIEMRQIKTDKDLAELKESLDTIVKSAQAPALPEGRAKSDDFDSPTTTRFKNQYGYIPKAKPSRPYWCGTGRVRARQRLDEQLEQAVKDSKALENIAAEARKAKEAKGQAKKAAGGKKGSKNSPAKSKKIPSTGKVSTKTIGRKSVRKDSVLGPRRSERVAKKN